MGFFSKKKKGSVNQEDVYGLHGDDENLPVATLVTDVPMPMPPPEAPKPSAPPEMAAYQTAPISTTTQQPTAMQTIPSVYLTRFPTQMDHCPCCQASSRTRVITAPNWVTWMLCLGLLLLFWPLCWLPLVMTKAKQSDHYCTSCNMKVGTIGACTDCCVQSRW